MEPMKIGRYLTVRRLGQGGMGAVYLATDPQLERQLVVKLLHSGRDDDSHFRERFLREARAAAGLRHPNIVTIYDLGTDAEGRPYIAMEYVEGESLAEVIRRRAPLKLGEKLDYLKQLCAGLSIAHDASIIHRDIKPANIMVNRSGTIKILDFGLAHLQHSGLTQVGTVMGTLNYMSPEQFTGRAIDTRSDIFAVGAVAYELLAYRQAFPGSLDTGAMYRLMTTSPKPLRDVAPRIDPELEAIVTKCLQKNPADRYQDLASMSADIKRVGKKLGDQVEDILELSEPMPAVTSVDDTDPNQHATQLMIRSHAELKTLISADEGTRYFPPSDRDDQAQDMPDVQLVISSRVASGIGDRVIKISRPSTVIGRNPSCEVVLADPACSSRHAAIAWEDSSFTLQDMGSRNGTYVNGRLVPPNVSVPLLFGTRIEVGQTTLRFSYSKDTRLPDLTGAHLAVRYAVSRLLRESEKSS